MHSNEERGRLDSAIDRTVRGMMQVDPRPGLRHRVAGRLAAPPRSTSWMFPAAAAAAVVAVVFVSWTVLRTPDAPVAHQSQIAVSPAPTPDSRPSVPGVVPVQPAATAARRSPARQPMPRLEADFGPRRDRVTATSVDTASAIAPMPPAGIPYEPPPFIGAVAPLTPILIAPIEVEPITITPLTVSTLPIRR